MVPASRAIAQWKEANSAVAQAAADLASEASGGHLDGGADPVAVPAIAGVGVAAAEDRDGEELGLFAADADGAHGPLPANDQVQRPAERVRCSRLFK